MGTRQPTKSTKTPQTCRVFFRSECGTIPDFEFRKPLGALYYADQHNHEGLYIIRTHTKEAMDPPFDAVLNAAACAKILHLAASFTRELD